MKKQTFASGPQYWVSPSDGVLETEKDALIRIPFEFQNIIPKSKKLVLFSLINEYN